MKCFNELLDFIPVELCNLDYSPEKGAAIDPHFDDFWLWGERLVTINFLSDTYLSMTKDDDPMIEILVPMPQRSLIVVSGDARNLWKHGIHRTHIKDRRIAMTWRELTPEFLEGGPREHIGKRLINVALEFKGVSLKTFLESKNKTEIK